MTETTNKTSTQGDSLGLAEQIDVAVVLVRLSFVVQTIYGEIAATHDLTPAQAKLLCIVKDAPRGMTELTHLLQLEKSSVSGLVDRTHQRQLIERQPSTTDRRAVTISLSSAGKKIANSFYREVSSQLARIVERLPDQDRRRFLRLTTQIIERTDAD